ncbi:helix-turn-helix domain-containing protein [Radicibacter daui]|uniref:helix-turn-helix domain-containing protein n=1 Tax=Radicibacter daui TaxID=3064829 RepID=UPI004046DAD6
MSGTATHVELRSYGHEAALHIHDHHHQVVLPRSGRLELEIDGCGGFVAGGTGAFIPAGTRHAFVACAEGGTNAFVVADISLSGIEGSIDGGPARGAGFFTLTSPVLGLLDYAAGSLGARGLPADLAVAWSRLLLGSLAPKERVAAPPAALSRALAFMHANLAEPLTAGLIAREAGISRSGLYELFAVHHQAAPLAVLRELRLAEAVRLLQRGRLPVAEVALRAGYADQGALTRALRRERGATPAALRRGALS